MFSVAINHYVQKLIPYPNIQTQRLGPLLFLARLLLVLSCILFGLALFALIAIPFFGSETVTQNFAGMRMTSRTPDRSMFAIIGAIWSFSAAILALLVSGLCAALVSFEATYTARR